MDQNLNWNAIDSSSPGSDQPADPMPQKARNNARAEQPEDLLKGHVEATRRWRWAKNWSKIVPESQRLGIFS